MFRQTTDVWEDNLFSPVSAVTAKFPQTPWVWFWKFAKEQVFKIEGTLQRKFEHLSSSDTSAHTRHSHRGLGVCLPWDWRSQVWSQLRSHQKGSLKGALFDVPVTKPGKNAKAVSAWCEICLAFDIHFFFFFRCCFLVSGCSVAASTAPSLHAS